MSELSDKNKKPFREEDNFVGKFSEIEKDGLNYIKIERNYLILSALVPIYIIIVQCINLGYIFIVPPVNPLDPRPPVNPIITFTPILILLVVSFFALINFRYLLSWKGKVKAYEGKVPDKQKTLTALFYDIIKNMEIIRVIFIIVNIISFYYFIWFILWALSIMDPHHPPPPFHVNILNGLSQGGLLIYLIIEWRHFIQWNRKLKQLKLFEKQIFHDICELNRK
ncbi:MAG: hypothetical protein ACFFDF_24645 [Candidatus Odinarchaeota archaeon]